MNTSNQKYTDVPTYIAAQPKNVQPILRKIRKTIKAVAPNAVESISYGMPAYKHHGKPLVYFSAFAKHIGFYATPQGHEKFAKQLSKYKQGKGSVQFQLEQPIPYELIEKMTKFNYAELSKRFGKK